MTDAKLKSLAERVERLMDERDGLGADIRDIFTEAKSAGYVPKVLRKAITRKRMDPSKRDEEDAILELYEDALGGVGRAVAAVRAGATWKEAVEDHGVPRATLARAVKVSKRREELRTDTGGEITPTHEMGAEHARNSNAAPEGDSLPVSPQTGEGSSVTPAPDEGVGAGTIPTREGESCGPGSHSGFGVVPELSVNLNIETLPAPPQPDACSTGDQPEPLSVPGGSSGQAFLGDQPEVGIPTSLGAVAEGDSPQRVAPQNDDGLDIPSFLRRVVVAPASPAQLDEREERAAQ